MDCFRIHGGVPLSGTVAVSGSKNAALPIMAAAILAQGPVILDGVPRLSDVSTLALLLCSLGLDVAGQGDGSLRLETIDPLPTTAHYRLVRRMRASFCTLGPLLARRGRARVGLPGGCRIGDRGVDLHLSGLAALGADIRLEQGYVIAQAARLRGAEIDLRGPLGSTVTGTANVMSAATLAEGRTVITSAAREPEIVDLGRFLIALGARISGLGTDTLEIVGVAGLEATRYRIIPDRIEAGTLLMAAAITGGMVRVQGVVVEHLTAPLEALAAAGLHIVCGPGEVTLHAPAPPRPISFTALPYPGIPTDLQAQFMALMSCARGTSVLSDQVFPDRFTHVAELRRLGADISRAGSRAIVRGVAKLSGAPVTASDLRASAALVLAGLAAHGQTVVRKVHHLDRGYDALEEKLAQLGARITRCQDHHNLGLLVAIGARNPAARRAFAAPIARR
jgi:UDP-N-acetylglucosamine 1-carboxyvinyltransferase